MKVLTAVFLGGIQSLEAPGSKGDGQRWLLATLGGKKTEPGVGSRV